MLPALLKSALENAKQGKASTARGIIAMVAALAWGVFLVSSGGLDGDKLAELAALGALLLGSAQQVFVSKK